jgi:hypothetical protein
MFRTQCLWSLTEAPNCCTSRHARKQALKSSQEGHEASQHICGQRYYPWMGIGTLYSQGLGGFIQFQQLRVRALQAVRHLWVSTKYSVDICQQICVCLCACVCLCVSVVCVCMRACKCECVCMCMEAHSVIHVRMDNKLLHSPYHPQAPPCSHNYCKKHFDHGHCRAASPHILISDHRICA